MATSHLSPPVYISTRKLTTDIFMSFIYLFSNPTVDCNETIIYTLKAVYYINLFSISIHEKYSNESVIELIKHRAMNTI